MGNYFFKINFSLNMKLVLALLAAAAASESTSTAFGSSCTATTDCNSGETCCGMTDDADSNNAVKFCILDADKAKTEKLIDTNNSNAAYSANDCYVAETTTETTGATA